MAEHENKVIHSRLVFLHELDSVRNSAAEIKHARNRLYEEIMVNGNIPVISFNQLADSKAFLGLVSDGDANDPNRGLRNMKYLMESGRIRVVRFRDKRTPSQYLQDNLAIRNGKMVKDRFILSGWPIPAGLNDCQIGALHDSIRLALRNSDPNYLDIHNKDDTARAESGFGGREAMEPRLGGKALWPLKQLVEFMLFISKAQLAYADVNTGTKPQFADILMLLLDRIESGGISSNQPNQLEASCLQNGHEHLIGAGIILRRVENSIRADPNADRINARSTWHNLLKDMTAPEGADTAATIGPTLGTDAKLAFQLVDLCYNTTVEAGVDRCSHFLNPADETRLDEAAGAKLAEYQDDYDKYSHTYSDGSLTDSVSCKQGAGFRSASNPDATSDACPAGPDWGLAVDIQKAVEKQFSEKGPGDVIETYRSNLAARRKKWRNNVYSALGFQTLGAFLYMALFAFIEVVLSLLDNFAESTFKLMISADSPGVEDLFSANRTIAVTLIFLVGVASYALATSQNGSKKSDPKIPLVGIAAIFFIVMPLLACIDVVPRSDGMGFVLDFTLGDFVGNFISMLPSLVVGLIGVVAFAAIGSLLEERTGLPGLFESMRLVKRSVVDSWKYAAMTRKYRNTYGRNLRLVDYDVEVIPPDSWGHLFEEKATACGSPEWRKYKTLIEAHDQGSASDPALPIVMDEDAIRCYKYEHNAEMGVVYDSQYNSLVVDLVRDGEGNAFTYERLIPKADSGVVVVPVRDGKFVLLRQFRHAIRERQWGFPRGFGEKGLRPENNACKELSEELGLKKEPDASDMKLLGVLTPDSGVSANKVSVFWCNVGNYSITMGNEGIEGVREFTEDELRSAIAHREITDGFTLAAFAMWECSKGQ